MVSLAISQSALLGWFRQQRIGQLSKLVNVLLIIWLAWLSAKLTWLLVPEPEQTEQAVTAVPAPVTAAAAAYQRTADCRLAPVRGCR